jgi:hypothetical protein
MHELQYTVELGYTRTEWTFRMRSWHPIDGLPSRSQAGDVSLVGELYDPQGKVLNDRAGNPIIIYGNTESALRFQVEEKLRRLFLQEPHPSKSKCICA